MTTTQTPRAARTRLAVRFVSPQDELAALVRIRRTCLRLGVRVGANRTGWMTTLHYSEAPEQHEAAVAATKAILDGWGAGAIVEGR